jgi:hypothetical protein
MNVQKAGCILLDLMNKKVGLIYRQKQNDYSFSKGHLELRRIIRRMCYT